MTLSAQDAERLRACLAADGVAVIPTDTVYGLACNPESQAALERIYELKGRAARKPAAVMFFALEPALEALSGLGPGTRAAIAKLLPGPLTLLLADPSRSYPLASRAGPTAAGALGLRVPLLTGPLAALRALSLPVAQSSANLSGRPDACRLADVPESIRAGADVLLDAGELPGVASTVLDLRDYEHSGAWSIVRCGPVGRVELEQTLGPT
ncbi:MAG TPA: Sua5/YciO/YrdC/YwlC family protein [Solirubrobacteraceae bacterium]